MSLRLPYAAREKLNIDLDADVASLLRSHAAEAHVSEGVRIAARAIRTLDLRSLVARIRERRDFDDEQAMALARGELQAVTSPKLPANVGAVLGRPRLRRYLSTYEATRYVDDLAALTVQLGDPAERHAAVFRDPREDYLVALAQSSNAEAVSPAISICSRSTPASSRSRSSSASSRRASGGQPMQKVEGSGPFIRFAKSPDLRAFCFSGLRERATMRRCLPQTVFRPGISAWSAPRLASSLCALLRGPPCVTPAATLDLDCEVSEPVGTLLTSVDDRSLRGAYA